MAEPQVALSKIVLVELIHLEETAEPQAELSKIVLEETALLTYNKL
jgi:hypothetical protein